MAMYQQVSSILRGASRLTRATTHSTCSSRQLATGSAASHAASAPPRSCARTRPSRQCRAPLVDTVLAGVSPPLNAPWARTVLHSRPITRSAPRESSEMRRDCRLVSAADRARRGTFVQWEARPTLPISVRSATFARRELGPRRCARAPQVARRLASTSRRHVQRLRRKLRRLRLVRPSRRRRPCHHLAR